MFIRSRTISYIPEEPPQQDEGVIRQWAGTHDLKKINGEWGKNTRKVVVTLRPGVRLDVRFLCVASVLGSLLLPPAMQVCGKRMFGVV